jgi:hypothetical protein
MTKAALEPSNRAQACPERSVSGVEQENIAPRSRRCERCLLRVELDLSGSSQLSSSDGEVRVTIHRPKNLHYRPSLRPTRLVGRRLYRGSRRCGRARSKGCWGRVRQFGRPAPRANDAETAGFGNRPQGDVRQPPSETSGWPVHQPAIDVRLSDLYAVLLSWPALSLASATTGTVSIASGLPQKLGSG